MALPTTISGINVNISIVGPFISSAGNVYFFGRDGTTATTLQAYKATDPTSSFASVATQTGYATAILQLAATQDGDDIHIAITDGTSGGSVNQKYIVFSMSSDAFSTAETVQAAYDNRPSTATTFYMMGIVFRASDSQPVILYNGPRVANMGTSYSRIVYARRTGTNAWTTNVAVDSGGTVDWVNAEAISGSSDRIHFFWYQRAGATVFHRVLNSSNALQTGSTAAGGLSNSRLLQAVSYDASGTQKIAVIGDDGTNFGTVYFNSADTVTQNVGTEYAGTEPARLFNDGTDVWALYRKAADADLYVRKSTDHGATFGGETRTLIATVAIESAFASGVAYKLSVDGNVYVRGGNYVIPYVVNDNGTLKYNEYTIRAATANKEVAAGAGSFALTGAAANTKRGRKVVADAGSYAFTGQTATISKGRTIVAGDGSYALTGQDATLRKTYIVTADAGTYSIAGTDAGLRRDWKLAADAGSYAISGQEAALRHAWRVAADAGSFALTGTDAGLIYVPVGMAYDLTADAGAFALTGQDVTLRQSRLVTAGEGTYNLTGQDATLRKTWRAAADAGSFTLNGQDAALRKDWRLAADAGSFALSGQEAALRKGVTLAADAGAYTLAGQDAALRKTWRAAADAGSYDIVGQTASLEQGRKVSADAGTYTLGGQDAGLYRGWRAAADAGSYTLTGFNANLTTGANLSLDAESGAFSLSGQTASLERGRKATADAGSYSLTGQDASLKHGRKVDAQAGAFSLTGQTAGLYHDRTITAGVGSYSLNGSPASLEHGRLAAGGAGSYALDGQAASLALTGAYAVLAEQGTYAFAGSPAELRRGFVVITSEGSYAISGENATLTAADAPVASRRDGDISYSRQIKRRMRLVEARRLQELLDAEDDEAPPPPTHKRIRTVKREIVSRIDAAGLLGPARPAVARFVQQELVRAYVPQMDWGALRAAVARIAREAEEEAARIEQEIEDEDESIILMVA